MTEEIKRYSGPATVRGSYMNEFVVECPKCKKEAWVSTGENEDKLICPHCNYMEYSSGLIRYDAIVKRSCDNCGQAFETTVPNNKEKVKELTIPCPNCGVIRAFHPRNKEFKLAYKNDEIGDSVFNLPLWFQCNIKGHLFWAYNREHLNEIRSYVSSKLRERQTTTHTTMVERLPNFIKEAKNRGAIIKAIDRLLKK